MLWTVRDVAEALSLSQSTIWLLVSKGEIPVVRLGRSVRFRKETIEALLAERESRAGESKPAPGRVASFA